MGVADGADLVRRCGGALSKGSRQDLPRRGGAAGHISRIEGIRGAEQGSTDAGRTGCGRVERPEEVVQHGPVALQAHRVGIAHDESGTAEAVERGSVDRLPIAQRRG